MADLFDREAWDKVLAALAEENIREWIQRGAAEAVEEISVAAGFDVTNPEVARWLDNYVMKFARKINDVTEQTLRATIGEGLTAGESIRELMARVDSVLGDATSAYRSEMISRTESSRAEQHGRLEQYRQSGVVQKVWVAAPDACDLCMAMDGTVVGVDEVFLSIGDTIEAGDLKLTLSYEDADIAMLHPNDRCSIKAVLEAVE